MKLLVKVKTIESAEELVQNALADAICLPHLFPLEQARELAKKAKERGMEVFLDFCFMMVESEVMAVKKRMDSLKDFPFDYLLYTDLGMVALAEEIGWRKKLFYDGGSLLTNSLDAYFYRHQNAGAFLARELTLSEIRRISHVNRGKISCMMAGFLPMSISKRHFIQAYFDYLHREEQSQGFFWLKEEKREDQWFPIVEDEYGTTVYTDSIFLPYEEWEELASLCEYGMIDASLLSQEECYQILCDVQNLHKENASQKLDKIRQQFPERTFDTGYLYRKTNVVR